MAVKQASPASKPAADAESDDTATGHSGAALDFSSEGAVSLGGKVPLPSVQAAKLPPPPRPGMEEGPEFRVQEAVTDDPDKPKSENRVRTWLSKFDQSSGGRPMERAARADFQVLIVDRDDIRRGEMLQWLTELGFRQVTVASAPTSAVTF